MDSTVKAVGTVIGIGAGAFIGWKVYRKMFPSGTDQADKNEAVANTEFIKKNNSILKQYEKIKKPTYQENMYAGWKAALYKAMDGIGSSFPAIKNILGYMKSDTDVVKMIDVFGIMNRKTNNPLSSEAVPLSLPGWLAEELSDNEIYQINKMFADKHIGFRF